MGTMSLKDTSQAAATCTIPAGPAWKAAREYGCDMSIIEDNLRKTPAERIRAHAAALNTLLMLKNGKRTSSREAGKAMDCSVEKTRG